MDTGYLKDWTLVQIEGEQRQETDTPKAEDTSKDAKGKGKAPPPKGGEKKVALEEITDDRPREIRFEKELGEGLPMKITEEVGRYFETYLMKMEVYKLDKET